MTTETPQPDDLDLATEKVEDMSSALSRLAAGAGKNKDGRNYDICSIDKEFGYSFNGTVYTRVLYPFGFTATIPAQLLRKSLACLSDPTVRNSDKSLVLSGQGRSFKLAKLSFCSLSFPEDKLFEESISTTVHGLWLKRLLSITPTVAGFNSITGVLACPEGYVACEPAHLGYIKAKGPDVVTILPRELISVLPSENLKLFVAKTEANEGSLVKIEAEDGSAWAAPTLAARFPDWKGALKLAEKCDRRARVSARELADHLRAVTSIVRTGWIEIKGNTCSVYGEAQNLGEEDSAETGAAAKATLELESAADQWIKVSTDLRKLLWIIEPLGQVELEISSTPLADRLFISTTLGLPHSFIVSARRGVQDKSHASETQEE